MEMNVDDSVRDALSVRLSEAKARFNFVAETATINDFEEWYRAVEHYQRVVAEVLTHCLSNYEDYDPEVQERIDLRMAILVWLMEPELLLAEPQ